MRGGPIRGGRAAVSSRRLACGGGSPSDERRVGATPAWSVPVALVGAAGQQHRLVDADRRRPVADAVVDELGHAAVADPVGGVAAGAAVRDSRGGDRRSRRPAPVAADRADVDARRRAVAGGAGAGGGGDAVDAARAAVRRRCGPGVDGADVADAAAGTGAGRRTVAGDRARLGQHEPRPCGRAGARWCARGGDGPEYHVLRQRGDVPGRDRRGGALAVGAWRGVHAPAGARAFGDPRERAVRRQQPGAALRAAANRRCSWSPPVRCGR